MLVVKRDGSQEELNISQIRKQTIPACEGLDNTSYEELELAASISFYDGIKTYEIQDTLIKAALGLVDVDKANYTYVAQRLMLYDLYHKIKHLYNKTGSGDVYDKVTLKDYIEFNKEIFTDWYTKYTDQEINYLNGKIIGINDLLFDHTGFVTFVKRYGAKINNENSELPQHMHMAIAMYVMQNENKDNRLKYIEEYYKTLSNLEYINATPINSNGRLKRGSLISCLVTTVDDDLDSIYNKLHEVASGSKKGSGWGIDFSKVRSVGSDIGINKGVAGGKIPFLKLFNDTAIAVNQAGIREGSFAIYIDSWDIEVFDYLKLRTKSGEERRRARDLFYGVNLSNLFMEREEQDQDWVLFDPKDVPELCNTYGEEFNKCYLSYEDMYLNKKKEFNKNTRVVKARDVMRAICQSLYDNGMPFIFFKDTVNIKNKHKDNKKLKELGLNYIRSSNLCTEIMLPTSADYTAVCNLGSINVSKTYTEEDLRRVTRIAIRALDNAIDITPYPSKESEAFQKALRTTGLGTLGLAEYIANKQIMFGSEEHKQAVDRIYKTISDEADKATADLAKEKGSCIIEGIRNAYLMAVAPNSTSGLFAGTTNSHEAVFNKVWIEENKLGSFRKTAPHLDLNNFNYYVTPYEVDMEKQLDVVAVIQKYVDQGISTNAYLDPNVKLSEIRKYIRHAWSIGLKTLYYLRTKPPKADTANDIISCVGCAN